MAPEQFLHLSTIFCYLVSDFYVKTMIRFSLRDKLLFEVFEVQITTVDCMCFYLSEQCVHPHILLQSSLVGCIVVLCPR